MNSSLTSHGVRVRGGALALVAPLVMHVHTFDQPLGQQQNPDLVRGLSRHLVYHRCALHVDHYEVTGDPPSQTCSLMYILSFPTRGGES